EAMIPLARWGVKRLGPRREGETFSLSWMLLFLRETTDKELTKGVHDVYEFHVDDWVFHVIVDDGHIDAQPGPAPRSANLKVTTDFETFAAAGPGELRADRPGLAERMQVEVDPVAPTPGRRI